MNRRSFIRNMFIGLILPFVPSIPGRAEPEKGERDVVIQQARLAGFKYYDGERVWRHLAAGESLALLREPGNPYDRKAVEVKWRDYKLGYIPRLENESVSQLLDQDVPLKARLTKKRDSADPWERLEFEVYLTV